MRSNAVDVLFAEQAFRPYEQDKQRERVGKPHFDAAAHEGTEIDLGQCLAHSDDEAAKDRARCGPVAPSDGLYLTGVTYEAEA